MSAAPPKMVEETIVDRFNTQSLEHHKKMGITGVSIEGNQSPIFFQQFFEYFVERQTEFPIGSGNEGNSKLFENSDEFKSIYRDEIIKRLNIDDPTDLTLIGTLKPQFECFENEEPVEKPYHWLDYYWTIIYCQNKSQNLKDAFDTFLEIKCIDDAFYVEQTSDPVFRLFSFVFDQSIEMLELLLESLNPGASVYVLKRFTEVPDFKKCVTEEMIHKASKAFTDSKVNTKKDDQLDQAVKYLYVEKLYNDLHVLICNNTGIGQKMNEQLANDLDGHKEHYYYGKALRNLVEFKVPDKTNKEKFQHVTDAIVCFINAKEYKRAANLLIGVYTPLMLKIGSWDPNLGIWVQKIINEICKKKDISDENGTKLDELGVLNVLCRSCSGTASPTDIKNIIVTFEDTSESASKWLTFPLKRFIGVSLLRLLPTNADLFKCPGTNTCYKWVPCDEFLDALERYKPAK